MRKIFTLLSIMLLSLFLYSPVLAASDLDGFIKSLNVEAQADLGAFKVGLSSQFRVPVPKIEASWRAWRLPETHICAFGLAR